MAHRRRPLGVALTLNTAVLGVELWAGNATGSLSLISDIVHNLSDETALWGACSSPWVRCWPAC